VISLKKYPNLRLRRNRLDDWGRKLTAENTLTTNDLIFPMFLVDGNKIKEEIRSMPGIYRYSLDELIIQIEHVVKKNIPLIALFPKIEQHLKDSTGSEALNYDGIIPKAILAIKKEFPDLGVMTDIALDPYTSHGQDGLINDEGYVLNDETVEILTKQSLLHAEMGVDIVAPSDMMDGRIGVIREALENQSHSLTRIMAYSAKYASGFYSPFRDAVGSAKNLSKCDKRNYQMNPANSNEALLEAELDINEGADMVMIKPGLPYLDIVQKIKETFKMPTFAYQVSGEYSMIKLAGMNDFLDEKKIVMETLIAFKRAGCDGVLSYFALSAADWIKEEKNYNNL
jgi:porphobilinogen synthase